jgi:hypothetical protein
MPEGKVFTKEEVSYMLEAPSLPSPDQRTKKKSTVSKGPRAMKNCAQTLHNRKVNLPSEVKNAPGTNIPVHSCSFTLMTLQCYHVNSMSHTLFKTVLRAVLTGAHSHPSSSNKHNKMRNTSLTSSEERKNSISSS